MKILALDGNSLAYRAFFALPTDMATASGQVTNAVFGFVTMLTNLVKEQRPDGLVVVFDRREKTFRHEAAPEFKAQRESQPDILYQQLEIIREVLGTLGVTVLDKPGFEGDDLIATVVERALTIDAEVVVVTGDRDSYQLVRDPLVKVLYNKRGVTDYALYDEAGILEKTGVTPEQYPEYAAMRGDTSDNLEGIQGVGEKTAAKLMAKYGSLRSILDAADEQTPKLAASLKEGRERALRNLELMKLRRDVPIDVDLDRLAPRPDLAKAKALFTTLEFKALTQRALDAFTRFSDTPLPVETPRQPARASTNVQVIAKVDDALAVLTRLSECERVAVIVAGDGESGVAFADDRGAAMWFEGGVAGNVVVFEAACRLRSIIGHDVKSVLRWLLRGSGHLPEVAFDSLVAAYIIDPALGQATIDELAARFLGEELVSAKAVSDELDFGGATEQHSSTWAEHAAV
ncbi:MAG: 5'-3' exonuclease H3TH domain-containing protein, partial [Ilumatobacteraceae bacterium]